MRRPIVLTSLIAVLLAAVLLAVAWAALSPSGPLLAEAAFSLPGITPNADGDRDVTVVSYTLRRPAEVSIYFIDAHGQRYYFRRERPREAGEHQVAFSGVVEPFTLPGENFEAEVLARVLPDGDYTWVVEASDGQGPPQQITGPLAIREADTALPLLTNFTVSPPVFTPNQDGIDDRAFINVGLSKDVGEGGLRMYLISEDGTRLAIAEEASATGLGRAGLHEFNYDGGVDLDFDPPPDGTYTILAEAEDALGQRTAVSQTLTIAYGGLPRAEIVLGEVEWSATSVPLSGTLYFTLTVENYGTAPLRTSGPDSGFVYESMLDNHNTVGEFVQAGAWRVGIHCETCGSDYPWRWALGSAEDLTVIPDSAGRPQYYLMPGERVRVTGGIVLDRPIGNRNPQYFWAGLIHEDVQVVNDRVNPEFVAILDE